MNGPHSNFNRRRFQGTGFGLERDRSNKDNLPIWKKQMFSRIRNKSKQHRQSLLARLENQKNNKNVHNIVDSFKNALITEEMKEMSQINANKPDIDIDYESSHLTAEQYQTIFAELAQYLEQTELSQLRQSYIKSLEEKEKDLENDIFQEIIANEAIQNPFAVLCPICCKNQIEIEYAQNNYPIYSCLCGAKFQARDKSIIVCDNNGSNKHVQTGHNMLKILKKTLNKLTDYHVQQLHCKHKLNFAVINENGHLQCWCCQCNCNEIVI